MHNWKTSILYLKTQKRSRGFGQHLTIQDPGMWRKEGDLTQIQVVKINLSANPESKAADRMGLIGLEALLTLYFGVLF
jgi:hypothetical protein